MVVVGLERVIAIMVGVVYYIVSTTKGYKHDTINTITQNHTSKGRNNSKRIVYPLFTYPPLVEEHGDGPSSWQPAGMLGQR
jgi:hypothetical protein